MEEERKTPIINPEDVFKWHKQVIEENLQDAEYQAGECNVEGMLRNFYTATLELKGLQSVFEPTPQEVTEYIESKKSEIRKDVIPSLSKEIKKCRW